MKTVNLNNIFDEFGQVAQFGLLTIAQRDKCFGLAQAAKYIGDMYQQAAVLIGVNAVRYIDADVAVSMQFDPRAECYDKNRLLSGSFPL